MTTTTGTPPSSRGAARALLPAPRAAEPEPTDLPSVTVVVPTVLRPSLARAVGSVRGQDYAGRVVVVVVVDRDRDTCTAAELARTTGADEVLYTGGGRRAGHARNLGVQRAATDLVALLDDDDAWLPGKLGLQVPLLLAQQGAGPVVVTSRLVQSLSDGGPTSGPVPARLLAPGEPVADYLFLRRRARADRPTIQTSTLLMTRATARALPWSESLPRHQDWDWLVAAQRAGVRVVPHPSVTVTYALGSPGSISASPSWQDSLTWARGWRDRWSRRTYADFVCGQPLRYAVQARSWAGVRACARELLRTRRLPHTGPALFAASAVLPRPLLERALLSSARSSPTAAQAAA